MRHIICILAVSFLLLSGIQNAATAQSKTGQACVEQYQKGRLLYQDSFDQGLRNWIAEVESTPDSRAFIEDEKLVIDVGGGATVWLNKKLSGNILIEYKRTVIMNDGPNDRLSDLNQFWMATDPENENLFTRDGVFASYHPLSLYYAGIGGNYNSTTRFRKYDGTGERILLQEKNDKHHLLKPNHTYHIQILVNDGTTKLFVDGDLYFSYTDPSPLKEGYFGFRTVKSHQEIDDLKIYQLK
ncbi:DUF6250 domain-containing protein [Sunxiuqinia indica]|uniref:DUF6250 domain-containing protein n=1 Tax=Sunxiuqinia indica TaxID=2692584 RepID=UPI00135677DD|nr:DUF6250 domain-containing protein [Sunxiuqinia indica]